MKTKAFDCVEMKHKAGEQIYQQLKGKSIKEQIEFWQKIEDKYRKNEEKIPVVFHSE